MTDAVEIADASTASKPRRISELLQEIIEAQTETHVTVGVLVDAFGDRSFGALLTLMALPNCVPGPPGFGSIFGIPILFFAGQMALGQQRPWLPQRLRRARLKVETLRNLVNSGQTHIRRFEKICRPRLLSLTSEKGERWLGLCLLFLGFVVCLPVPLSNMIPGWGIAISGLGIAERDGLAILIGGAIGLLGVVVSGTFMIALILSLASMFA